MKNQTYRKIKDYKSYLILLVAIFGIFWLIGKSDTASSKVIARQGIHWHSRILININGVNQEIPANVGLETATHNPLHTHDEDTKDGVIHMEFSGLVTEDSLRVKNFFKVWKKQFTELCVFDDCSDVQGKVVMLVNGQPNNLFGEYSMKDGDIIEITFAK